MSRRRAIGTAALTLLISTVFLRPALAEQAAGMAEARRLFERGVELFSEESYPAALASFESSYALRESPVVLFNIAMCQRALFRFPDAIDSFREYLRRWGEGADRERRDEIAQLIEAMGAQLLLLSVNVSITDAEIMVDGELVGRTPLAEPLRLGPGEHVVEARAPGYEATREVVTVTGPGERDLTMTPQPLHSTGRLRVSADVEDARLSVDGETVGPLPAEVELSEGVHSIEVRAQDFEPRSEEIQVTAGETHNLELHLEPSEGEDVGIEPLRRPWYTTWWFWTAVGIVVTGGVVAGVVIGTNVGDWGEWEVQLP